VNYIPVVAWGLDPGGTDVAMANYFGSWGLRGSLPNPSGETTVKYYAMPTHPRFPTMTSFDRSWICSILLLWLLNWFEWLR